MKYLFTIFIIGAMACDKSTENPVLPKPDLQKINGSWVFETVNIDGNILDDSDPINATQTQRNEVCTTSGFWLGSNYNDVPKWNLDNVSSSKNSLTLRNSCSDGATLELDADITVVQGKSLLTLYQIGKVGDQDFKRYVFEVDFSKITQTPSRILLTVRYVPNQNISYLKMVEDAAIFTLVKK